jgi:hypothetical protein
MIIGKGNIGTHAVFVHRADSNNQPYVTLYRNKIAFAKYGDWTDQEKRIAEQAIQFTLEHLDLIPEFGLQTVQFELKEED